MKKLLKFIGFNFCYVCGKPVWLAYLQRKTIRISEDADDYSGVKVPCCIKHNQEWVESTYP